MSRDLIERMRAHADNYAVTGLTHELCSEAADRIAALEAEASEGERLRAALRLIRLTDWSWPGGGSMVRVSGQQGRAAAHALGVPAQLPDGWPTAEELEEVRLLRRALIPAPAREGE